MHHHVNRVEALLVAFQAVHQNVGQTRVGVCPDVDDLVVTLVVGDQTHVVVVHHLTHLGCGFGHQLLLLRRNDDVVQVEGQTSLEGHGESEFLDVVQELRRARHTHAVQDVRDDAAKRLLGQQFIDEARFLRDVLVEHHTTASGLNHRRFAVDVHVAHGDACVQVQTPFLVGDAHLLRRVTHHAFAFDHVLLGALALFGDVVQAQHHVL